MQTFLRHAFLYIHLIGFALLLGGAVAQLISRKFRINPAMLWGSVIQLASGVALSAPLGRDHDPLFLGIKAVIAVLIFVMVLVPSLRKREAVAPGHFYGIVALTLVNAGIAVFWR